MPLALAYFLFDCINPEPYYVQVEKFNTYDWEKVSIKMF